ncbi:MAG: hypothetical protein DLM58_11125 [Pseudonocardiales bacterium]|nr:MAG: hypothetical protein DLM58_11125 [Pseudonocardiales bacterium]
MSPPGEVEFFVDSGTVPATDEDAVDLGQSQVPRWALVLAVVLIAGLLMTLAAQTRHKPVAMATPQPLPIVASPTSTSGLGAPIPFGRASPALDLGATIPIFVLESGRLYRVTDTTAVGVNLDGPGFTRIGTPPRLVLDAAANRVWVVPIDTPDANIVEFDAGNLHRLRTMHSIESVRDAAALGGHLYLARSSGLADAAPGATAPTLLPVFGGFVASVAADPKRHRLLALVLNVGASMRQITVGGTVPGAHASVPVAGGNVRVTQDGAIWLAGFGSATAGAVVLRLDPKTLRPLLTSPVAARLGASSRIESAGDRDIWVRSAGDGEGLWCVDGRSGSILQHWPSVRGAVASVKGVAFASMGGALVPLVLDACSG